MASDDRPRNLLAYVVAAVVLVCLAVRVFGASGGGDTPAVALDRPPRSISTPRAGGRIWIHVAGAVRRPGLYRVAADARAGTAVEAAGGLARRADGRAVNLAAAVRDGQQIVVPTRGERAVAAPAAPPSADGGAGAPARAEAKVSLSTATVDQLDALDGIGPTLAQRILKWRDAHGGFKSVEQLREVEGIGEKRFEALRSAVQP
jgi:competence protein ComEA